MQTLSITWLRRTPACSPQSQYIAGCHQQGPLGSKTLHQQNPPVLDWRCRLTQVDLYNSRKTAIVVVVVVVVVYKDKSNFLSLKR